MWNTNVNTFPNSPCTGNMTVMRKNHFLTKSFAQDRSITFLSLSPQSRTDGKPFRKPVASNSGRIPSRETFLVTMFWADTVFYFIFNVSSNFCDYVRKGIVVVGCQTELKFKWTTAKYSIKWSIRNKCQIYNAFWITYAIHQTTGTTKKCKIILV